MSRLIRINFLIILLLKCMLYLPRRKVPLMMVLFKCILMIMLPRYWNIIKWTIKLRMCSTPMARFWKTLLKPHLLRSWSKMSKLLCLLRMQQVVLLIRKSGSGSQICDGITIIIWRSITGAQWYLSPESILCSTGSAWCQLTTRKMLLILLDGFLNMMKVRNQLKYPEIIMIS